MEEKVGPSEKLVGIVQKWGMCGLTVWSREQWGFNDSGSKFLENHCRSEEDGL